MQTYVILRRHGWRTEDDLNEAADRSTAENVRAQDVAWVRSYMLAECDGTFGTVCVYQAASPEAVRRHATAASLPVDEIVEVADTFVIRPDPEPAAF
jgi:hypothetical protein